jgi:hypothetical protein
MPLVHNMKRFVFGAGSVAVVPAWPDEQELLRVSASTDPAGPQPVDGDLVLTDQRVYFAAAGDSAAVSVRYWLLPADEAPSAASAGDPSLSSVTAGSGPSLGKPPTLVLVGTDGGSVELGVLAGPRSLDFASSNAKARDAMVEAIENALSSDGG